MYQKLKTFLDDEDVVLVAVSKTRSNAAIMELYDQGQRIFGENRVQELVAKQSELPQDIAWHLIGHLQKNKVKYIAPFVSLIHSVDSLSLAQEISKEGSKNQRIIPILLQVKIAMEDSKYGWDTEQLAEAVDELKALENVEIKGMMGMGTFTDDEGITLQEFATMKSIYQEYKEHHFTSEAFQVLSMGMSGDYELAVKSGSTMVRIGSLLFSYGQVN